MSDPHTEGEIQRLLAEDAEITELGIDVICSGGRIELSGEVPTAQRRDMIAERVAGAFPDADIHNAITVAAHDVPHDTEDLT